MKTAIVLIIKNKSENSSDNYNVYYTVCITFNPKNSRLSCPSVRLNSNI